MDAETQLMLRVKGGSKEAFEDLYQRFRKPLANFIYRLCWNQQTVEDMVQEVFMRVWRAAPNYEPRAKVSTWIFRIAHNLWINESMKKREKALEGADSTIEANPSENIERKETRDAVKQAIEELPDGEREVLILAEYNDFKYQQISEILDIPVGTVKSRMFSAMRRLRDLLQGRLPPQ